LNQNGLNFNDLRTSLFPLLCLGDSADLQISSPNGLWITKNASETNQFLRIFKAFEKPF